MNALQELAGLPIVVLTFLGLLFGVMVGSFLNVVIFRFPKSMMHQWTVQSREWLELPAPEDEAPPTLSKPRSHCGVCKAPIKTWQNIPVLSYLILGGKCGGCKARISIRYPSVELLTGLMSAIVVYHFGWSLQTVFGVFLTWLLIALSFIDIDHRLLPDDIVIPGVWLGLGLSLLPVFASTHDSVVGAIGGYMFFWIVFQMFLGLTGKEGMGHGDFKLIAMLGAWLGWQYLPLIILISSVLGGIFGTAIIVAKRTDGKLAIPFGPHIAIAGWVAMLWGDRINQTYLKIAGL